MCSLLVLKYTICYNHFLHYLYATVSNLHYLLSLPFQHALVIEDIDKRKIGKLVRNTCAGRRKYSFAERCEDREAILRKINQIS